MRERPLKQYIAVVTDAEGVTYHYPFAANSRRHAEDQARDLVRDLEVTLVAITPVVNDRTGTRGLRLLAIAGITFVLSGVTIAAMMVIGLSLEGAL